MAPDPQHAPEATAQRALNDEARPWAQGVAHARAWAMAPADLARRLGLAPGVVIRALAVLAWERAWVQLWPLAVLALGFAALAWSGAVAHAPLWGRHLLLLAAWTAAAVLAVRAVLCCDPPRLDQTLRRLETDSGLHHRPFSVLLDQPAHGPDVMDGHGAALWRRARARAAADIQRLRLPRPASGVAARDRWSLRYVALALALVTGAIAGDDALPRLGDALRPGWPVGATATAPTLDLWVSPPAYTGLSPQVLARRGRPLDALPTAPLSFPNGSVVTVGVSGQGPAPELSINGRRQALERGPNGWRLDAVLTTGGHIGVRQGGRRLGDWVVRVVADQPPAVAFHSKPDGTQRHTLRLDYTAADDYGVTAVTALVHPPATAPKDAVLSLALPVASPAPRTATGTGYFDLTASPWAGQTVTVELLATDAAGQTARSPLTSVTLPERVFRNPVAQAVIAQRKALILAGDAARPTVAAALLDIASVPGGYGGEPALFMGLYAGARRLSLDQGGEAVGEVVALLWQVALRIEDGRIATAETDLRDAQNRLMDALNRKADQAELASAMDDLRQAMARFVGAMAQNEAARQADAPQDAAPPETPAMAQGPDEAPADLEQMLRQLQDLAQSGERDAAKQMLDRLRSMMEDLRQDDPSDPQTQAARAQAAQAQQALDKLARLAARQRGLLDETFRTTDRPDTANGDANSPSNGDPADARDPAADDPIRPDGMPQRRRDGKTPNRASSLSSSSAAGKAGAAQALADLARRQEALRQDLATLAGGKDGDGPQTEGTGNDGSGAASQAMAQAGRALADGDAQAALSAQGRALAALEQSLKDLAHQMASQGGARGTRLVPRQAGRPLGTRPGDDPLGRSLPGQGTNSGEDVHLPSQPDIKRAREILDELRRRSQTPDRPQDERDYIDRLLQGL